jgi:ABC-type transport system involved in cytochrome c biogenesis permease subunit
MFHVFTGRPRWLIASLAAVALLINVGIAALVVSLAGGRATEDSPAQSRIIIPFEDDANLWEPFRRWVVQEDGRNKPFDTFCRETVRAITGREHFEEERSRVTGRLLVPGHDPVPVVISWLMLSDADPQATDHGAPLKCHWEHHRFLYCPSEELRGLLGEKSGNHMAPAVLRSSPEFTRLLHQAKRMMEDDSANTLPPLESAAVELQGRLDLYDRVRTGGEAEDGRGRLRSPGEFGVVALDRVGRTWFSLQSFHLYAGDSTSVSWDAALRARRRDHFSLYEGTSSQEIPATEVCAVYDTYLALQANYRAGSRSKFAAAAEAFLDTVDRVSRQFNDYPGTDTVERELWYNRVSPFRRAWLLGLLTAFLLSASFLFERRWIWLRRGLTAAGLLAYAGLLTWAAIGFFCRVTISDRPPVSNMYESLIWVAFVTASLGLGLALLYRRRVAALAGALVATLGLILADGLPLTFSPSIQPLQAVLRSNYWLIIHVLPIVSSYAPFALAWGLGNLNLLLILQAPGRVDLVRTLSGLCYRAIQVGVLLLFLGTMLGGFWAAKSWGRFWGWDPKEVWALIALLCYLIPLHARYVGWVGDFGLAVCSVVCFTSVVMAWYGVNFVLGAGLHAYAFGNGDHRWVYLAALINLELVVLASIRYLSLAPWRLGARS